MCLMLTVRLHDLDASRAAEICQAANVPACLERRRIFSFSRRPSGAVNIPGPDGGCGCSFLADTADWDAPTWDMIPSTLPRLAAILRAIRQQTTSGFTFEASWDGQAPADECRVTIDELAPLVERSRIGTKTRYLVE